MTQYKFPPAVSDLVQKQLASGQFATEDEVLLAALQTLETESEDWLAVLKHLIPSRQVIGECRCKRPLTKFENVTQFLARHDLSVSPAIGGCEGSGRRILIRGRGPRQLILTRRARPIPQGPQ